jgi:hypothetical protein
MPDESAVDFQSVRRSATAAHQVGDGFMSLIGSGNMFCMAIMYFTGIQGTA